MRPPKVPQEEVIQGLMSVLRRQGFDGASLSDLASATGLQKASLYHRYPRGKQEIAESVLKYVTEWIEEDIRKVLAQQQTPVSERVETVLKNISGLYGGGKETCLLRALGFGHGQQVLQGGIAATMEAWIEAFYALGIELGRSASQARLDAQNTLVWIQGSLVVSQGLQDDGPFAHALDQIRQLYSA